MTNLINWNKNNILKFSIDDEKIDEDLTDFPLLLNITATSGLTGFNCSNFFNDLEYPNFTTTTFSGINGSLPDKDLWTVSSIQKVFINNNNLRFTGTTTEYCESNFLLSGNFNIQVDIDATDILENNSWSIQLQVLGISNTYTNTASVYKSYTSGAYKFLSDYNINGTANLISNINNNTNPSKLKIYRTNSTCYFSFWDGTTWISLGNYTTTTTDIKIRLLSGRWDNYPNATLDFNNFIINEGTITWPTKKHPNAKKIALVYPSTQEHIVKEYSINDVLVLQSIDQPNGYTIFKDYSQYNRAITVVGNTIHSIAQAKFGTSSIYFDGEGDYLSLAANIDLDISSGDFTVEGWLRVNTLSIKNGFFHFGDITSNYNRIQIICKTAGEIQAWLQGADDTTNQEILSSNGNISIDTWYHIALVQASSTLYFFVNGVLIGSSARTVDVSGVKNTYIGAARNDGLIKSINGYIDDFRITKGVARYTANFTPPDRLTKNNVFKTYNHTKQELLYCEVENFDQINKSAQLWTKVPKILHNQPTDILLYYDSTQENNTPYVGTIGDFAAQQVWNASFVSVYHMNQDPSLGGACIFDSTLNMIHGTPMGNMTTSDLIDGVVNKALDFDGVDDFIKTNNICSFINKTNSITISIITKRPGAPVTGSDSIFSMHGPLDNTDRLIYWINTETTYPKGYIYNTSAGEIGTVTGTSNISNNYYYTNTFTYDQTTKQLCLYVNNFLESSNIASSTWFIEPDGRASIGQEYDGTTAYSDFFGGSMSEVRIANKAFSSGWVSASHFSCFDTLCTVTSGTLYFISGYVYENETAVQRTVYLYERSSGDLMDRCVSNSSNGYYLLKTTSSGTHNIVCIDDIDGVNYDDIILSKIIPTEVA